MGQGNSNSLRENLESLHNQLMKHAGADYDIATTTTLTYDQFLSYITQLNQMWIEVVQICLYSGSSNFVFRRITYECTGGSLGTMDGIFDVDAASKISFPLVCVNYSAFFNTFAFQIFGPFMCIEFLHSVRWTRGTSKSDMCLVLWSCVLLRTVVDRTCPVCRESLKNTDDTWVLSEVPDNDEVTEEIRRALIGLAGSESQSSV
nr:uncharacterized protein LOC128698705 [Cherax quadricarinatus]